MPTPHAATVSLVFGLVFGLVLATTPALADAVPIYPVDANCREARSVLYGGSQLSDARKQAFEADCVRRQQEAYEAVKDAWPTLQVKDQRLCTRLVTTTNYILLANCVASQAAQETAVDQPGPRHFHP